MFLVNVLVQVTVQLPLNVPHLIFPPLTLTLTVSHLLCQSARALLAASELPVWMCGGCTCMYTVFVQLCVCVCVCV